MKPLLDVKKSDPSVESLTNGVVAKSSKKKKSKSEKSDKPDKTSKKPPTENKESNKDSSKPETSINTSEKIEVDQPLPPPSKWDNDDFDEVKIEPDLKQNMLNKLQKATATLQSIKAASLFTEDSKTPSNICKS